MDMEPMGLMAMPTRRAAKLLSLSLVSILARVPAQAQIVNGQVGAEFPPAGARSSLLTYGADVGIGESDNVTLSSTDKVKQTMSLVDFDFDLKQRTRRLDVDAKGSFTDLYYFQHAYGNEVLGRFDGMAQFALVPEHLMWVLQDDWGQAVVDPFGAVTPNNQENVNYVSTGPDAALRLGSTGFVDVTARYARTQYSVSPFDNYRLIGTVAIGMPLSAQSSVSLNGSAVRVLFSNTAVNGDFSRGSAYGHYEVHGARTDFLANLGANRVNQGAITAPLVVPVPSGPTLPPTITTVPQSAQSSTGPLAKLELSRKLSSAAKLTLDAGREFTDATVGFSTLPSGTVGAIGTPGAFGPAVASGTAPAATTSTNYTVTYGSVGWNYKRDRTTLSAGGRWEKDAYDKQTQLDLTRGTAQLTLERRLTRALSAQLLGTYYKTDYAHADYHEKDKIAGGALVFRDGRWLEVRLRYDHISRAVSGIGAGFGENRVFVTVGYRPQRGADRDALQNEAVTFN
jgi:hypothetical protein